VSAWADQINALSDNLEQTVSAVFETATASDKGGGPAWDRLLRELGLEPPSAAERAQALATDVPIAKGPVPAEVRRALEKLHAAVAAEATRLQRAVDRATDVDTTALDEQLDQLAKRLGDFVDTEVKRYIAAIRPAPAAAGIFANALATTPDYAAMRQEEGVETKTCKTCGAARPAGTDLETCDFCGGSFF
jgi:hypothetical protein